MNLEPFDDQSFGSEKALFWGVGWPLKIEVIWIPGIESNHFGFLGNATWKRGLVLKHPLPCHRNSVFPSLWPEFTGKFSGKHPFQLDSPFFFHILDLTFSRTPEHLGSWNETYNFGEVCSPPKCFDLVLTSWTALFLKGLSGLGIHVFINT